MMIERIEARLVMIGRTLEYSQSKFWAAIHANDVDAADEMQSLISDLMRERSRLVANLGAVATDVSNSAAA